MQSYQIISETLLCFHHSLKIFYQVLNKLSRLQFHDRKPKFLFQIYQDQIYVNLYIAPDAIKVETIFSPRSLRTFFTF